MQQSVLTAQVCPVAEQDAGWQLPLVEPRGNLQYSAVGVEQQSRSAEQVAPCGLHCFGTQTPRSLQLAEQQSALEEHPLLSGAQSSHVPAVVPGGAVQNPFVQHCVEPGVVSQAPPRVVTVHDEHVPATHAPAAQQGVVPGVVLQLPPGATVHACGTSQT